MVSPASDFDSVFEQAGPASKPGDAVSLKRKASDQGQRENLQVYEAPKVKLTAALFHELYGNLVSEQFAEYTTARTLRVALSQREPPIIVTDGMLKIWFAKFRLPSDAVTVSSAEELHRRYGDLLPALAAQNPTAYRLTRVLKARTPPLYVSDAVLKQWLLRYFDAEPINSAGHLELKYGDRIREHAEAATFEAADLRVWLRTVLKVDASEQTCRTWRVRSCLLYTSPSPRDLSTSRMPSSA